MYRRSAQAAWLVDPAKVALIASDLQTPKLQNFDRRFDESALDGHSKVGIAFECPRTFVAVVLIGHKSLPSGRSFRLGYG